MGEISCKLLLLLHTSTGLAYPSPCIRFTTNACITSEPDVQRYETAISELQAHYPQSLITGCSALAGIVDHKLMENGLLVSILQFQNTTLAITAVKINNMEDSGALDNTLRKTTASRSGWFVIVYRWHNAK